MNYSETPISQGIKYPGFWWYMLVELVLLLLAFKFVIAEDYQTAFIIFILIEIRDIRLAIKNDH